MHELERIRDVTYRANGISFSYSLHVGARLHHGGDNTKSVASNWAGYKKRQRARGNSKAGSEADPIGYLEAAIKDSKLWVIER